ncbi:MAG TPA: multicopper oxidase family protein [Ktedonosporobacter sp.]|nr:multicopper oxidase family protein [Ktedonosporobacter sp.]
MYTPVAEKPQETAIQEYALSQDMPVKVRKQRHLLLPAMLTILAFILIVSGSVWKGELAAPALTKASSTVNTLPAPQPPTGPEVPNALNMGMAGAPTSLTALHGPTTAAHVKQFTLTAQAAQIQLGSGVSIPAWTFNGSAPGPTLRVQQGDLVVVTVVNHLSFGVTIHWHGINVPNMEDGVAGVTQDAIKPGRSYVYHFIASDPGTYWYHSHQFSYDETTGGLYGTIIVDPATPTTHDDVDYNVALHDWNATNNQTLFAIDSTTGTLNKAARPGQWVRLRIVNSASSQHLVTLLGAPFQVAALDGHDVNGPQMLSETPLPIGAAQRYDLRFQMPTHGPVTLVTSADNQHYQATPAVVIGQGNVPATLPAVSQQWFDLTTYGLPKADPINLQSHFAASYDIKLGMEMGDSLGRQGMVYTFNGKVFPNTGMIMVQEGQIIRLHLDNTTDLVHPIHLHGHTFTVLTHNGKPLTGSPIHLDTINIQPHNSYDIAFLANNPGIWMLHCHNLLHANWGMDMMIMYNISTPYTVGTASGNFPD